MKLASRTFAVLRIAAAVIFVLPSFGSTEAAEPTNVLMIAIDDLRPALGCYGDPLAVSPNIDALASDSTLFLNAYCQQAVCNPSRASLLTGRRPDHIRVWDLNAHFRDANPDIVTLPQYFRTHGYLTQSIGKVLHGSGRPAHDPPSWTAAPKHDVVRDPKLRYASPRNLAGDGLKRASFESANVTDDHYIDGIVCRDAVEALRRLRRHDQPFFLAVGFRKPHLPFCAPEKYWRQHDANAFGLLQSEYPKGAPELAVRSWKELEGYTDIPNNGNIPAETARNLRHGYYACVSYVDALVGRLLDQLDQLGLADSTLVVLWGDHGFHLGEQGLWTKSNNYELATRAPLMIRLPGDAARGQRCSALVEFVDLFPTLVELCGLPELPTDGISMKPLLDSPDRDWKQAAYSQFPRMRTKPRHKGHGDIMGYAVRTTRFRFVQWRDWQSGSIVARELYDHHQDPGELRNVVELDSYTTSRAKLETLLQQGFPSLDPHDER